MSQPSTLHPNTAPASLMEVLVAHGTSREDAAEVVEFISPLGLGDELMFLIAEIDRLFEHPRIAIDMTCDPEEPEYGDVGLYIDSRHEFAEAYARLKELRELPVFDALREWIVPMLTGDR